MKTINKDEKKRIESIASEIIDSTTDAIITTDLNGRINFCNTSAELLICYSAKEMIGKSIVDFYPKEEHLKLGMLIEALLKGTKISNIELTIKNKDEN